MARLEKRAHQHRSRKAEEEWESPTFSPGLFMDVSWPRPRPKEARQRHSKPDPLPSAWHERGTSNGGIERSDFEVREIFHQLAEHWREETLFESNVEHLVLHPSYQKIIGLGPQVVPYILEDLRESPDHWFWALTAIVGEDKAAGQTSIAAAVEAWLAWGTTAGIYDDRI